MQIYYKKTFLCVVVIFNNNAYNNNITTKYAIFIMKNSRNGFQKKIMFFMYYNKN